MLEPAMTHTLAAVRRGSERVPAARVGYHAPPCWGRLSSRDCTEPVGRSHAWRRCHGGGAWTENCGPGT